MTNHSKHAISLQGLKKLEEEMASLNKERILAVQSVVAGREHGDLRENAEYQSAREWQTNVETKISNLMIFIQNAEVIDIELTIKDGVVRFGSIVALRTSDPDKTMKLQILGEKEANFEEQKISIHSPLARALVGKKAGEIVIVEAPSATREYEILEVL